VGERHIDHFIRITRALGSPVPKGRAEAVRDQVRSSHAVQQRQHGHIAERLVALATRKQMRAALLLAQRLDDGEPTADNGTRCSLEASGRHRPDLTGLDFRYASQHDLGSVVTFIRSGSVEGAYRMLAINEMPNPLRDVSARPVQVSGVFGAENAPAKSFELKIGKQELFDLFCKDPSIARQLPR
jgi:hypothetical protein